MGEAKALFILSLHGVGEAPPDRSEAERRHWIRARDLSRYLDLIGQRSDVRLTFDDANASDHEVVLPLLLERGMKAEFYIPAGLLGHPGRLDGAGLRSLAEAGMEVGSHGIAHRSWRGLAARELRSEICDSRRALEDLIGAEVGSAACPFGEYDRRVLAMLRRAGYARALTCDGGPSRAGAWLQHRITLFGGDDPERLPQRLAQESRVAARLVRAAKGLVKRWR